MREKPIIFALANPEPEIDYFSAKGARPEAIVATGRSDFPNQVNNVLGFPYIFRGALDARATKINDAMKLAAVRALAELAREDVPGAVIRAYDGQSIQFGPEYIIPKPFDDEFAPRLFEVRQRKGWTLAETQSQLRNPYVFGAMMVREGLVDGQVHGIAQTYPNAIRPVLQVIPLRPGVTIVAGLYLMLLKNRTLLFADCTVMSTRIRKRLQRLPSSQLIWQIFSVLSRG
jgi:hypothetical protein